MKRIRVLLCDDQTVVRDGLEAILSVVPHMGVFARSRRVAEGHSCPSAP